jgi:glycosyltransferase involved in cell wall biosynthesis
MNVSVVILTKNEAADIEKCLRSLSWSNDIHVLDSGSTDSTVAISKSFNAKVSVHPFVSFGEQRNFALDNLDLRNEWILFLDADEVATDAFRVAMNDAIASSTPSTAGFYCCWKMILENRWLKRCDSFPKWQFRLLKHGRARFVDFGHGQKEGQVDGTIEYLREPYLHYGFSKGWAHWIDRHNRYSTLEAEARTLNRPPLKHLLSSHGSVRNPAIKSWLTMVPGWPLMRFFFSYVIKLGFLEGIPGFIYCVNIAYYEFLIQIKIREHRKKSQSGSE